ncbi:Rv3235 family protein [Actinomadura fibrosa]|uniref:Rv3235 family protein n=1 Tax=Actinomadura fibrosa TaxID=111802 RepID=A0ABW2XI62_9ACTN|nr:Rv3235 family protein [Actinomadura fibrosa]
MSTRPAVRIVRYQPRPPAAAAETAPRARTADGALALNPAPMPAPPGRAPGALRLVQPGDTVETELRARAEATVRLLVEVLAGTRPPQQLARLAVPAVCRELGRRGPALGRSRRAVPPQVLTSWLQRPAPGAAEAGAVVAVNGRIHAVALRLELLRGRWQCTALETTAP